jgi:hypothetical protein
MNYGKLLQDIRRLDLHAVYGYGTRNFSWRLLGEGTRRILNKADGVKDHEAIPEYIRLHSRREHLRNLNALTKKPITLWLGE